MEYKIRLGDDIITLEHDDIDQIINVDDLTNIDTGNIYGEAVTISPAINRVGLMRAELESMMASYKLDEKMYINSFTSKLRKQAYKNSGKYKITVDGEEVEIKLTEKALESAHENDPKWVRIKKKQIQAEKNFNMLSSLYWAMQEKSKKLNNLVSKTTPEEFVESMIEGKINGLLVQKNK